MHLTEGAWGQVKSAGYARRAAGRRGQARPDGSRPRALSLSVEAGARRRRPRSALPCNAMYLDMLRATEPGRLASAAAFAVDGKAPTFLGSNYVHPTARIHPSAKARPSECPAPSRPHRPR